MTACYHGDAGPPPPTCTAAAAHVGALIRPPGARAGKIRDVIAARCAADGWSPEVRACVVATASLRRPRHCKAKLTTGQRAALDRDLAHDLGGPAAVPAARLPPSCITYRGLIERLGTCSVLPPALRAAFEQGYRQLVQDWAHGALHDAAELEVQCRLLASGLRNVVAKTCGW
jgi:hypothetical protein